MAQTPRTDMADPDGAGKAAGVRTDPVADGTLAGQEFRPLLAGNELLRGLPEADVAHLAAFASRTQFPAGAYLFHQDWHADHCHLIQEGLVALEVHGAGPGELVIDTVGPGALVGLSWLVPPYRWQFDARAVEPVRSVVLDARCLRAACNADPRLGYELTRRVAALMWRRLHSTRIRLSDLHTDPHDHDQAG